MRAKGDVMEQRTKTAPTETWVMVATVGMLFTAMGTALAVFVASGALSGVDPASLTGLWGAAIALASVCLLMAAAGVAIYVMRTRRSEGPPRTETVSGPMQAT